MSDSVALTSAELASELESWLSPEERKIVAGAGYGRRCGWGKNPALLVVDATYSFCGRTRMPIAESIVDQRRSCGEDAWDALDRLIPLITQARRAKVPVIFSAMEDPSSPEYEPGLWGIKNNRKSEDAPALASTEKGDNEIVREIAPLPGEMVYSKGKPSLFFGTGLLPYLISKKIDSLIICGGTTSGCVYATAVDGFSNNFQITAVADASFDRIRSAHWMFLLDIDLKYGDVVTSQATIEYFRTLGA